MIPEFTFYLQRNMNFILQKCKSRYQKSTADAELLMSSVLEKMWKYRSSFKGNEEDFKRWIFIITKNEFISQIRVNKKMPTQDISFYDNISDSNISKEFDEKGIISMINKTVNEELNDRNKKVYELYFVKGYKYEEIARILSIPLGSVKNNIFVIRMYLRSKLKISDYVAD